MILGILVKKVFNTFTSFTTKKSRLFLRERDFLFVKNSFLLD